MNIKAGDKLIVLKRKDGAGLTFIKLDKMDKLMFLIQEDEEFFNKLKKGGKIVNGFSKWQKVIVVSGFVGFIVTGIYSLGYSLILELLFIFSLLCFLLLFFFVMCKDCDKSCPFNLKKKRR